MILFTLGVGHLIDKVPEVTDLNDLYLVFYSGLLLGLLVHGFNMYRGLIQIKPYSQTVSFELLIRILIVTGVLVTLVNVYITYKAFGVLLSESINVQEYKNEGEAADFLVTWVGAGPLFLSRLFSPIGYIAIGLHFYFLIKKRIRLSLLFLIISLNIPLFGFHGLSRAAAAQYLLIYFAFYLYCYKALSRGLNKVTVGFGIILILGGAFLLNTITESRFTKYYYIPPASQIQDPILYSTLDYLSQWNLNGFEVLKNYSVDELMFGRSNLPIVPFVGERLGLEFKSLSEMRFESLGEEYDGTFNGVVSTFVYDFGFIFSILLAFLFYRVVVRCAPKNGTVSLPRFLAFGVLIPLPLMFFTNSVYSYIALNMAIIYLLLINFLMKLKKA